MMNVNVNMFFLIINKKLNEKEIMRNMEKKCKIKLHGPFECITHVYLSIIYFIKC